MRTIRGYLAALDSSRGSGLAVLFISKLDPTDPANVGINAGQFVYAESGFGVRQIVEALGENGSLTEASARKLATFTVDDLRLVTKIEVH